MTDELSLLVLWDAPSDAPGCWLVREQRATRGGEVLAAPIAFCFRSYYEAIDWLSWTGRVRVSPDPSDPPEIVGIWM